MKAITVSALRLVAAIVLAAAAVSARATSDPVVMGNARFTFITDNLVRMEYAEDGRFLDDHTLFAVDRTPREVEVKMHEEDGRVFMSTPVFTVSYLPDGCPLGQCNLYVRWTQQDSVHTWHISDKNTANLKGQLSTPMALDEVRTRVPLLDGLLSRDGWFMINDSGKDIVRGDSIGYRDRNHIQDIYLFVYGLDYKAAMASLAAISGKVPMPRKYVLGAWYCRWWRYTADDYRDIVRGYREHDFPLDVLVFDMDWHRQNARSGTGHAFIRGWTGYSWNRDLIPDPRGLLAELCADSIYVPLNDHPHDGMRPHEDSYDNFIAELGADTTAAAIPVFDAGDPAYMRAFFNNAHRPCEDDGIAFWWLDWQQDYAFPFVRGTTTRHLPWLNELYYADSRRNGLRGQGFSRWGGWGDHRHPIQFTGDIYALWEMLDFEVELTVTAGNCGSFFCAHDIGGFYNRGTPELYTRWTQFGLLNSSLRIHSCWGAEMDRRPWLWGEREEEAMRNVYHLRSRLMPYIYTSVRQCHDRTVPLLRGLYYEHPETEESYNHPGQFMFGDLILGAPVTEAGTGDDFRVEKEIYFPEGARWYSIFNDASFEGGTKATVSVPLEESPVFVKGGYPLPMQPYSARMTSAPLTHLVVRCYPGTRGEYILYEDDGITEGYLADESASTLMTYDNDGRTLTVTVHPTEGSYSGQPAARAYTVELPFVSGAKDVRVNERRVGVRKLDGIEGIAVDVAETDIRRPVAVRIIGYINLLNRRVGESISFS